MTIITKRLMLRSLTTEDAGWIARDIANPKVLCWLTSPPSPYGLQHARDFLSRFRQNPGLRAIEMAGRPCGVVSIERASSYDPARADDAELGYWLAESHWGQGIMTEAATALLDWYFFGPDDRPGDRPGDGRGDWVGSGWIRGNAASEKVLTKLGFVRSGPDILRRSNYHDGQVPVARVELTKATWKARRGTCAPA